MRTISLLLIIGTLTGCNTTPPDKIVKINDVVVPVVQVNSMSKSARTKQYLSLYQENKQKIDDVVYSLKIDYLQDVKPEDIFDTHSQAHQIYTSLTKLEEMQQMNSFYYKENNEAGLLCMNQIINSISKK